MKNKQKSSLVRFLAFLLPVICIYFTYYDYRYFGYFVICYFIFKDIYSFDMFTNTKLKNFYLYYPLIFYLSRFTYAISPKFNTLLKNISQSVYFENARFLDMQHLFLELYCNSQNSDITYVYKYDSRWTNSCPHNNYWGPLSKYISITNSDIWLLTLITSFVALMFIYLIYFKTFRSYSKNLDLLFFISISPPLNFLIDRMNVDVIIYILCFWILKPSRFFYFRMIILVLLALYKLHPTFLIVGFLIYHLVINKDKRKSLFLFFCLIFCGTVILQYYFNNDFYTARPIESSRSFGMLSDAASFGLLFNISFATSYILICIFLIFLIFVLKKNTPKTVIFKSEYVFVINIWFLGVSLYANYDYRIPLLFFSIFYLLEFKLRLLNFSLIMFIFLSPPPSLVANHLYDSVFPQNYYYYLDISFYIIISYLVLISFNTIINKNNYQKVS